MVRCGTFSPDGARLVTGGMDRTVRVWDVLNGEEYLTLRRHVDHVSDVAFSADGRFLYSCGSDNWLVRWEAGAIR
jgi:WD40 repeat protein